MSHSLPPDTPRRGSNTDMSMKSDQPDRRPSIVANTSSPMAGSNLSTSIEEASPNSRPAVLDEHAARLQVEWNDAICRNMDLPEGYAQVAVLIIEWAEHLDQLKTRAEVIQLEALFRNKFHYETETVSLCERAPPHQLRCSVSGFLERYDRPNNLLIIYYTGHSEWNEETGELEFIAKPDVPCVQWKCADTLLLEECSADTLAILDTCYASNPTKGGLHSGRTYQMLAASGYNRDTAGPGVRSFTAALIASLEDCLKEGSPFTVWGLMQKINTRKYRRDNPAQHHDRLGSYSRYILLAPLNKDKNEREKTERKLIERSGVADLVLRFNLGERDLSKEHIEALSKQLPKTFADVGLDLRRIELDGFEKNPEQNRFRASTMAINYAQRWLRITRKREGSTTSERHPIPEGDDHEQPKQVPTPKSDEPVTEHSSAKATVDVKPEPSPMPRDTQFLLFIGFGALSIFNAAAHLISFLKA